jgi:hypothetical protein
LIRRTQLSVDEAAVEPPGEPRVGMRGWEVRRVPGGPRRIRWEVTEYEPDHRYAVHGIDGPVRAHVSVRLAPKGQGTQVNHSIWFSGHGIGKVLRPFAQASARKEVPATLRLLKERLEA